MDNREKDIQSVCTAVLSMSPIMWDNPNGPYETTCPFCEATIHRGGGLNGGFATMQDLFHSQDCAYIIAKDLATGYSL